VIGNVTCWRAAAGAAVPEVGPAELLVGLAELLRELPAGLVLWPPQAPRVVAVAAATTIDAIKALCNFGIT
jgi:hypothetical protein